MSISFIQITILCILQVLITARTPNNTPICLNSIWDGQKCVKCPQGCMCQDNKKQNFCNSCLDGYYIQTQVESVTNITRSSCSLCPTFDTRKNLQCDKCCYSEQAKIEVCSDCPNMSYFIGGICKSCIDNCLTCNDGTTCSKCVPGYFLQEYLCYKCTNNNCLECSGDTFCNICLDGYFQKEGVCKSCIVQNCVECKEEGTCIQCQKNYFQSTNVCVFKQNCEQLDLLTNQCTVCQDTFYLDSNGECLICDAHVQEPRIYLCSSLLVPLQCYPNYVLVNGRCQRDMGCQTQISGELCTECYQDRFLDDGICHKCNEAHLHCSDCIIGGVYTKARCKACEDGYYLDNISKSCQKCSIIIPNCIKCTDSNVCSVCESFYLATSSKDQCQRCTDLNCFKCGPSQQICTQCKSGFTFNSKLKLCVPCGVLNCDECSYDLVKLVGFCTQCVDDYVLELIDAPAGTASAVANSTNTTSATNSTNSTTPAKVPSGNCIECVDFCQICDKIGICQQCLFEEGKSFYIINSGQNCINRGCALSDGFKCILCQYGYYYKDMECVQCTNDYDSRINCPLKCEKMTILPSNNNTLPTNTTSSTVDIGGNLIQIDILIIYFIILIQFLL